MNTKNLIFIFLFSFIFLSFVSSTSSIKDIEDICIPTDYQYLDYNLTEYINFHVNDVCYLWAKDPIYNGTSGHYHQLAAGYATLNLHLYEASYYFNSGHDWLRFESLSNEGYLDATSPLSGDGFQFWCCQEGDCGSKWYSNVFSLNVSDSCEGYDSPDNSTDGIGEVFSCYDFEGDGSDSVGSNDFTDSGTANSSGIVGSARYFDGVSDYMYEYGIAPEKNFTSGISVSVWFKSAATPDSYGGLVYLEDSLSQWQHIIRRDSSNNYISTEFRGGGYVAGSGNQLDGSWHHIVAIRNTTHIIYYLDNSYVGTDESFTDTYTELEDIEVGRSEKSNSYSWKGDIDQLVLFDGIINSTQISDLYNSGAGLSCADTVGNGSSNYTGTPPQLNSSIPDVTMNTSSEYSLNLDDYFWNWSDMYVLVDDPLNPSVTYQVWTGYATLNADYYDVTLYSNGTLVMDSYARPWNYTVKAYACNGVSYQYCINDTFQVEIQGNLSGVIELESLPALLSIGTSLSEKQTVSGNEYYLYYDEIQMSFYDTNSTGVLDENFSFSYDTVNSTLYYVHVNCTINQTDSYYNFVGDINVTLECGDLQSYYTLAWAGDYSRYVYFNASNSVNSSSQGIVLVYTSNTTNVSSFALLNIAFSNSSRFANFTNDFYVFFPDDADDTLKFRLVVLLLVMTAGASIILLTLLPTPVPFNIHLWSIFTIWLFVLTFFTTIAYVSLASLITYAICYVVWYGLKILRGVR